MVKIVILVAIVALACVNAQHAFAGTQVGGMGGAFDLLKNIQMMNQRNMEMLSSSKLNNVKMMTDDIINRQPGPHENYHAIKVKSQSSGDGKMRTSIYSNTNGKRNSFTVTN